MGGEDAEDTDGADDEQEEREKNDDPVEAIFAIIDRYYRGLKREEEGMGSE